MHHRLQITVFLAVATASLGSFAAPNARQGDVQVAQASESRCRKDVKDYVEAMRFVRQSAGAQWGDRVAGSYVSEPDLQRVANEQGPCAASQLLRDKGAIR